jgi:hypothetical protein
VRELRRATNRFQRRDNRMRERKKRESQAMQRGADRRGGAKRSEEGFIGVRK